MNKLKTGKTIMYLSQINICIVLICILSAVLAMFGLINLMFISPIFALFLLTWLVQIWFLKISKHEKILYSANTLFQLVTYIFLYPLFTYHSKILLIITMLVYALVLFKFKNDISRKLQILNALHLVLLVLLLIALEYA